VIQAISGISSLWQTMKTGFEALSQSLNTAQSAQTSGTQDQVAISQDALQKAATALLSDISNVQNSSAGTGSAFGSKTTTFQSLVQDITGLQNAIKSGDQNQIQSAENVLSTDLSGLQKGHHHHHHHGAQGLAISGFTGTGSTSPYSPGSNNAGTGTLLTAKA